MTETTLSFSPQQGAAIQDALAWAKARGGPQVFRIFGYAGSGKTTIAKEIAREIPGTLFATFTGKAALVMQSKGCDGASTIHSLIYKPWQDPVTGLMSWSLNVESPLGHAPLLIVDEVGMVDEELAEGLLTFGTKILVLGDPAQLPPIKGQGYFTQCEPDVMLTEVHRQAAESPIIRMSMDVREGRRLRPGKYGDCEVIQGTGLNRKLVRSVCADFDQVLCGKNRTRHMLNSFVRDARGIQGELDPRHPVVGDRLVCLKNNRLKGLLNGGLWEATRVEFKPFKNNSRPGEYEMIVKSLDNDAAAHVIVATPVEYFEGREDELDWRIQKSVDQFCHGYALTVHKAQGSQWNSVLLVDESYVFGDNAMNHLYTGITRAAERLTVVI